MIAPTSFRLQISRVASTGRVENKLTFQLADEPLNKAVRASLFDGLLGSISQKGQPSCRDP